ncbi:hypothetical protein HC891_15595 [Candidatus Gracilibacteria bacterium]|nr:hypothetical protein [Candidatus Gracilibacteria bacterium]
MKTYIIVEGSFDAEVLQRMLAPDTLLVSHIIVGGGKSSGASLARSLLSQRAEPVILVMDADTVHPETLLEQQKVYTDLLGAVAINTPYEVLLAIPELEVIFFQDIRLLEEVLAIHVSQETIVNGAYQPRQTLNKLLYASPKRLNDRSDFLRSLDETTCKKLAQHALFQSINAFVADATVIAAP